MNNKTIYLINSKNIDILSKFCANRVIISLKLQKAVLSIGLYILQKNKSYETELRLRVRTLKGQLCKFFTSV